jgi:hypothetical protein
MKKRAFKLTMDKSRVPSVNSLFIPWQSTDIISSNCPKHAGVRLARVNDITYQCPHGKEVYRVTGSLTNQTNRDNYYLGYVIKHTAV